ncbi:response regulator [Defluviitalea phaphyphila]|uniref:response regulator n=1 Tax=Defluviitalea phaphyphila TaxID=1473580 RepID=UPI0007319315|nr:response regulator [Defluviitalea phaphyphila]
MIKIMLVDDEKIVIDSLKFILEKNFDSDIKIVGTARSGREAIEKADIFFPDIIFMDIRMPGINGIEAVKEIKKRHQNTIFILLTAFDKFDFAKEAVNLGVFEYLLKPVNRRKVVEVVKKASQLIKEEREKRKTELELKEKLEIVLPILEHGFIYSMILFEENRKELINYKELFDIKENGGYVITIEFGEEKNGELENRIGYSIRSQRFYPFFRDVINGFKRCIVGPVMLNRIVIVVPYEYNIDEFTVRIQALSFAEQIYQKLSEKLDCALKIGIGRIYSSFEYLSSSYEESLEALRSLNSDGIMHYMDMPSGSLNTSGYPNNKEKYLFQKISNGNIKESLEAFNYIFDWLIREYSHQPLKIKNKLLEIIFSIHRIEWEKNINEGNNKEFFILEKILSMEDMNELRLWCKKIIKRVTNSIKDNKENRVGEITNIAKDYINKNYSKPITLEDISRKVNVSPQYFSKLFKEETGENFIDYLTNVRISAAKKLLLEGNLSIKEICYKIGYNDPNYFSRIFKKIVGVTPTEYR